MNVTLLTIRSVFIVLCAGSAWLVCYTVREWDEYQTLAAVIGLLIGALVLLVDVMLKGFSSVGEGLDGVCSLRLMLLLVVVCRSFRRGYMSWKK